MAFRFSDLFRRKPIQTTLSQIESEPDGEEKISLKRHLGVRDLVALGIAAIVGAGIFSTIGTASSQGGPAVILLFIFTAFACGFAAFAYAEFASLIPVSGSAYTYSYVSFGELLAWIIGWALIMEYAVGNATVAVSWSDYFSGLLESLRLPFLGIHQGIHLPVWSGIDYTSAKNGFIEAAAILKSGTPFESLPASLKTAYLAWNQAPQLGGLRFIADIPAIIITILITALVLRGIRESRNASNVMVLIKLAVVMMVIAVGAFYVNTDNWSPFAPNGFGGVAAGVSSVFFAYIGFDAISTTAEECKNPQHDLPRGMMYSIIICTILYIAIALVLTGMVPYHQLGVNDPLAFVFEKVNLKWLSGIIAVSAVVALSSVLLVFQLGQPRIWMSMSRDGLLPPAFQKIHPRFHTPSFATYVTGLLVIATILCIPSGVVVDLCSMGTLFAFVLVCGGVLILQKDPHAPRGKFRTPYINSKWIMPLLAIAMLALLFTRFEKPTKAFINNAPQVYAPSELMEHLDEQDTQQLKALLTDKGGDDELSAKNTKLLPYLEKMSPEDYAYVVSLANTISPEKRYESGWATFKHKIPLWLFVIVFAIITVLSFLYSLSLIPVLGLLFCFYMMAQIPASSWFGFFIWLIIGLVIYFGYSFSHSRLNKKMATHA
ncbi:MAG: amino acid permease [Sphingobacteriales bacterium]|nr:amino acid permease [Sphingobacteriales bacterium]